MEPPQKKRAGYESACEKIVCDALDEYLPKDLVNMFPPYCGIYHAQENNCDHPGGSVRHYFFYHCSAECKEVKVPRFAVTRDGKGYPVTGTDRWHLTTDINSRDGSVSTATHLYFQEADCPDQVAIHKTEGGRCYIYHEKTRETFEGIGITEFVELVFQKVSEYIDRCKQSSEQTK